MIAAPVGATRSEKKSYRDIWYFLLGSTVAGLAMGSAMGGLGLLVGLLPYAVPVLLGLGVVVAVRGGVGEVSGKESGIVSRCWQVPREWRAFGPDVFATLFGFSLGLGWLTYITFSGYYLMIVLVMLQGSVVAGAAIWTAYGLARALPLFHYAGFLRKGVAGSGVPAFYDSHQANRNWLRAYRVFVLVSVIVVIVMH